MGYNSEMAHKGNTQAASEAMPRIAHTVVVKGNYYFNARFPDRLIDAGLAPTKLNRKSLGTRDWREARRKAAEEYAFHMAEISRLDAELGGKSNLHCRVNSAPSKLSALSKREKRDLVLKWFVKRENEAAGFRGRFEIEDYETRNLIFTSASEELAAMGAAPNADGAYTAFDWDAHLAEALAEDGIEFKPEDISEEFFSLFRRAVTEVQWRTVATLDGEPFRKRDDAFATLHAFSEINIPATRATRTVEQLCDEFLETKTAGGRSPATLKSYNTRINILKESLGQSTALSSLEGDAGFRAAKKLVASLGQIPAYAAQRYSGASLKEASVLEAQKENPKFIEPKTQSDLFIDIKGIFDFAVKRKWISENPFTGLEDSLPEVIERRRDTFTGDELTKILSSDDFLRERTANRKGELAEGKFWCVILCLFHGMRLNEAASLLVSDIRAENGIDFMDFTEFDDAGNIVKRLKTKASRRRVPIHERAIRIGFLDYVRRRKAQDDGTDLFPDLVANTLGNKGGYTSRWFTRLRDKNIGKPKRKGDKSLHSLRHSVADAIRSVTDSDEILFEIGGWGSEKRDNSSRQYGKGDLERLKRVIDKVSYQGFDPSFLHSE